MTLAHRQAALSSPIRRLPPELLGEVFLFASSSSAIQWPKSSKADQQDDMPWLLCKVCSYWRTIAISVPGLWSHIRISLLHTVPLPFKDRLRHFLDLCLVRSKNELLTLSLEAYTMWYLPYVLDTLVAHSERWKDVSLTSDILLNYHGGIAWHTGAKSLKVPNLRRLYFDPVRPNNDWALAPTTMPLEAYQEALNLRMLSITDIKNPLKNFPVPWSQLTHFASKGSVFAEGEFARIMRHMPNLVSLSTDSDGISNVPSTQPVLLAHLRRLSITHIGRYLSNSCQFLIVPNLEALSIVSVRIPFVIERIVAMIERSGCRPRRLTLRTSLTPDASRAGDENANVVSLLAAMPTLTHLELTVVRARLFILEALANNGPSTEADPLLPYLDSLVLEDRLCTSAFEIANALILRAMNKMHPDSLSISLRLLPPVPPEPYELDLLKGVAKNHGMEITILSS